MAVARDTLTIQRLGFGGRVVAFCIALGGATPLAVASMLTPAAAGLGTHQALGLPACGWASMSGVPCPSCGMTTAFAWAARGDLLSSLIAQPMGMLLAVGSSMAVVAGVWAAVTGAQIQRPLGSVLLHRRVGWALLVVFLASWGWKIWAFKAGVHP